MKAKILRFAWPCRITAETTAPNGRRIIVSNAFALSMLDRASQSANWFGTRIGGSIIYPRLPRPKTLADCQHILACAPHTGHDIVSAIGHADTAALLSGLLGIDLPANRITVALLPGDHLIVGQYIGPRLPEGTTTLPDGARIEWWAI